MVNRVLSIVFIVAGLLLLFLSLGADLVGIGHNPGVNWAQVLGAITGIFVFIFGIWLWHPRGDPAASRLYRAARFITSRKMAGWVLVLAGMALLVVSLGADLLGIGVHPGFNRAQVEGTVGGVVAMLYGLWLLRPEGDRSGSWYYKAIYFLFSNRFISWFLIIGGLLLAILSLAADLIGIGHHNGINRAQLVWALIGLLIAGIGVWIKRRGSELTIRHFYPVVQATRLQRVRAAVVILAVGFGSIYFLNNIYSRINLETDKFECINYFFEAIDHVGADYRTGIYRPPKMVLHHENIYLTQRSNYPPFTIVFFTPLQLMTEDGAYLVVVLLLYLSNILTLALTAAIIREVLFKPLGLGEPSSSLLSLSIFTALLFYVFSSYPFMFAIERGNYDSIAMFFAVWAMYLVIKKPDSLWAQVILLSIATHLKIYPAVLFLVLLLRHGKRMILPTLLVNMILLLSLGFNNAIYFFEVIYKYSLDPAIWVGNHSGASFAVYLAETYPKLAELLPKMTLGLSLLPILVWGLSSYMCIRNMKSGVRIAALVMVSVPLMCLLPTTSHDYKLVILGTSLLILFALLTYNIIHRSGFWEYAQMLLALVLSFFIARSYVIMPPALQAITNKYPLIFVLSLLMLYIVYRFKEPDSVAEEATDMEQFEESSV